METAAGLIKLKPNTGETVEQWRSTIEARRAEALQTLRDEGVSIESWFQLEIAGEPYLLWYMRADSIAQVWEIAAKSQYDIDAYHFQIMSSITQCQIEATPIVDMSVDEDKISKQN